MMRFVYENPAVIVDDALVITDLHIGRDVESIPYGDEIIDMADYYLERILEIRDDTRELIILGDVKEPLFTVPNQVFDFFSRVKKEFDRVVVVKGNHDHGIDKIPDITVVNEYVKSDVGMVHGHAIPSPNMWNHSYLLFGHLHYYYNVRSEIGKNLRIKVYLVARLNPGEIARLLSGGNRFNKDLTAVFLPSFNPNIFGIDVTKIDNVERPFRKELFKMDDAQVYTLSGICLGTVRSLRHE